ncbi:MAG: type II secretion system F family protein [Candidatus Daviesbacteria bacterium]|nr:type II secretion system F family protein [Candidatus Daviesbacteria bacterium]
MFGDAEKDYFLENLAIMIASGIDVSSAITSIKAETRSRKMFKALGLVEAEIDSGSALWVALQKIKLLPDYFISLIRLGEESGNLTENLKLVVTQQQKIREFASKLQSAMIYPVIVFSLTLITGIGIAWFILPRLSLVFSQLRMELPLITKILISLGKFLGEFGIVVIPLLIFLICLAVYFLFFCRKTKYTGEVLLMRFPGISKIIMETELARLGFLLGTLLKAGLTVTDALSSLASSTTTMAYQKLYLSLEKSIEQGNSFESSFKLYKDTNKLLPLPIQQIIITSERSGRLPEVLLSLNQTYEDKLQTSTKNLVVMLEPVFLITIWLGVLFVALAVILPIYSLIGGLNK